MNNNSIEKVRTWLVDLGINKNSISSPKNNVLRIPLKTEVSNYPYLVFFTFNGGRMTYESPVFKSLKGPPNALTMFNELLLTYNGSAKICSFGFVWHKDKKCRVMLKGSQKTKSLDPHDIKNILDYFEYCYSFHVPDLIDFAKDTNLEFSGDKNNLLYYFMKLFSIDE